MILYLQIPYQPKFLLCSYILRHQEARMASKRHLMLDNTCALLFSLPAFTGQELSSQILQVITSTAVPWLSIQQTWQKPVCQSQIFIAVCIYSTDAHTQDLQSPHWVYVMLSFITCWNHKRCLLWDICPHGGKCQWDFMEKRKGLLWTSWSIQSSHTPGIRKNKINKLASAQFLLCVIYKKKHNQTLIFFRPGWA